MSLIHGMDLYVAQTVSDMGADGFRVVRMAFFGNWDPKKFLEFLRKNPELSIEEFQFVKERATHIRAVGMQSSRQARVTFNNQQILGVSIQGVSYVIPEITNTQP